MPYRKDEEVQIPRPVFQYTLDQVAMVLALDENRLRNTMIHFDTLTAGPVSRDMLTAHNIAPLGEKNDWRVTETEFMRWLKRRGYRSVFGRLY